MEKEIVLAMGQGQVSCKVPAEKVIFDLHGKEVAVNDDMAKATLEAIRNPIGTKPLRDIVKAGEKISIVISDITRLCGTDKFLPVIIQELNDCGISDQDITLVVATGTHRAHTPEENEIVVGKELATRLKIIQHNCLDEANMVEVGTTSFGNKIKLNRAVVEADRVIVTGAVTLHPMAGFGGGRKAIVPGVAARETVMGNHKHALAPEIGGGCNPMCDAGILKGNFFNEDMLEGCGLLNPDFLVNTVFTPDNDLYEVVAGHWYEAWKKGCDDLMAMAGSYIKEQADVVFVSAGGFPKDLSFYQGIKAKFNAIFALKKAGIMIAVLDCKEVSEPKAFMDQVCRKDVLNFEMELRAEFDMAKFVAFKIRQLMDSVTVYLVTRPENAEAIRSFGEIPCTSLEEAWELAQQQLQREGKEAYTIGILSHGCNTLPIITKE